MESGCMPTIRRMTSGEGGERDMEMTGYFKLIDNEDQIITLIARHGRVEVTVGTMAAKRYAITGC